MTQSTPWAKGPRLWERGRGAWASERLPLQAAQAKAHLTGRSSVLSVVGLGPYHAMPSHFSSCCCCAARECRATIDLHLHVIGQRLQLHRESHHIDTPAQQEPDYVLFVHNTTQAHERAPIRPACMQLAPSLTASHRLASPHCPFTCNTSLAPPRPTAATIGIRSHA